MEWLRTLLALTWSYDRPRSVAWLLMRELMFYGALAMTLVSLQLSVAAAPSVIDSFEFVRFGRPAEAEIVSTSVQRRGDERFGVHYLATYRYLYEVDGAQLIGEMQELLPDELAATSYSRGTLHEAAYDVRDPRRSTLEPVPGVAMPLLLLVPLLLHGLGWMILAGRVATSIRRLPEDGDTLRVSARLLPPAMRTPRGTRRLPPAGAFLLPALGGLLLAAIHGTLRSPLLWLLWVVLWLTAATVGLAAMVATLRELARYHRWRSSRLWFAGGGLAPGELELLLVRSRSNFHRARPARALLVAGIDAEDPATGQWHRFDGLRIPATVDVEGDATAIRAFLPDPVLQPALRPDAEGGAIRSRWTLEVTFGDHDRAQFDLPLGERNLSGVPRVQGGESRSEETKE